MFLKKLCTERQISEAESAKDCCTFELNPSDVTLMWFLNVLTDV